MKISYQKKLDKSFFYDILLDMKRLITASIIFLLASFAFAQQQQKKNATFTFSSFGGGLPSSAVELMDSGVETNLFPQTSDEDDSLNETTTQSPKRKSGSSNNKLIYGLVIGAAVIVVIGVGVYLLSANMDNIAEGCVNACGDGCSYLTLFCGNSLCEAAKGNSLTAFGLMPVYLP